MKNLTSREMNLMNRITTKTKQVRLGTKLFEVIEETNKTSDKLMRENMRVGQYGGMTKSVITFRFDDGHANDYTVYEMLKARKMVGHFSLNYSTIGNQNRLTANQIKQMIADGMEMGCHTMTHPGLSSVNTWEKAQREFVQPISLIEALGCRVDCFTAPGGGGLDDAAFWKSWGRVIRANYLCSAGSYVTTKIPTLSRYGVERDISLDDAAGAAIAIAEVNKAVRNKAVVHFLLHPTVLDQSGKITTAQLAALLDHVQTLRDAGDLEVLTLTGMIFSTPEGKRLNLCKDGDFNISSLTGSAWTLQGSPTLDTTDKFVTANSSNFIFQVLIGNSAEILKSYGGTIWEISFRAKRPSGSTGDAVMKVWNVEDETKLSRQETFVLTEEWKTCRHVFTVPTVMNNHMRLLLRGTAQFVNIQDVKVNIL